MTKQLKDKINKSYSENALKMMNKRYLWEDAKGKRETPADMLERVARDLAGVEEKYGKGASEIKKIEKDFLEVMANKEFTPAGRTVTNAGATTKLVANCIVLPIEDSMEGIFQTLKDAALLQQAGSGLGFALDHLRPTYTPTKASKGVSSGPVSFLRVYDAAFGTIKQQGRHGANMAMISVEHPDFYDFLISKAREGDIRNFNISVKLTDRFMKQVLEAPDKQWWCVWKGKKMKPHTVLRNPNGSVKGVEPLDITVSQVFEEIANYAWSNGEPGVVFIDEVNRKNPLPELGDIYTSNPCVTGDTLVPTEKGLLSMEKIAKMYGQGNLIISVDGRVSTVLKAASLARVEAQGGATLAAERETPALALRETAPHPILRAWKSGTKPVYKLVTDSGYHLTATADHKVITTEGKVPLQDLTPGHHILIQSGEGLFNTGRTLPFAVQKRYRGKNGRTYSHPLPETWSKELGQMLGWLIGDGWVRDGKGARQAGFVFSKKDAPALRHLKPIINAFYGSNIQEIERENGVYHLSYGSSLFINFLKALGVKTVKAEGKEVPHAIFTAPRDAVVGFLQGLMSADGTVNNDLKKGTRYVRLTSKSEKLLEQVQILLLNLGIRSTIYDRSRPNSSPFGYVTKGGDVRTYTTDGVLYELQISKQSLPRFIQKIGFLPGRKEEKAAGLQEHEYYREHFEERVRSITYVGEREVYDLTEPFTSSFIANGLVISNCGEQFLHAYDNCNLGSINLAAFAKDGKLDEKRLREVTRAAVRMLDNVIDRFDFPVDQVTDMAVRNRRIGLGIMGFADLLYQLGVKYNSAEGYKMAERAMATIQDEAHKISRELAKEKGAFPNWKLSTFAKGKKKTKMRNAALTTVAPTGSIAMMFDCSSGLEPNFALAFIKQDKDGEFYHYLNRHFENALDERGFSKEEKEAIKEEAIAKGTIGHLAELPQDLRDTFVVAMDISGPEHIKMQASFQKNVDNSISKTINLPNEATIEDVKQSYIDAWKMKCKSCTVYRDGSRNIQILNVGKNESEITKATEDPTKGASEVVEVVEESSLVEISASADKVLQERERPEVLTGKTYRVRTGYGKLFITINSDERGRPFEVFATLGKSGGYFQEQTEAICRLISLALRSRISPHYIIEHLKGIRGPMVTMTAKGTILSLPDAIAKIMEEHITGGDGEDGFDEEVMVTVDEEVRATEISSAPGKDMASYGYMPECPECGAQIVMSEGCMECKACGYSRCG